MQDAQLGSTVRHQSLESHAQGKLAYVVRRGADGKGQRKQDLASSLPDSEGGCWKSAGKR